MGALTIDNKRIALLYMVLRRIIAVVKSNADNVIDKSIFVSMRKSFSIPYKLSCLFYNSYKVDELIAITKKVLAYSIKSIDGATNIDNLNKVIEDSINNLNGPIIMNLVDASNESKEDYIYIGNMIKGIMMMQIISYIYKEIGTIESKTEDNINLSDTNEDIINILTEHINDINDFDDSNSNTTDTPKASSLSNIYNICAIFLVKIIEKWADDKIIAPGIDMIAYFTIIISMIVSRGWKEL